MTHNDLRQELERIAVNTNLLLPAQSTLLLKAAARLRELEAERDAAKADRNMYDSAHKREAAAHLNTRAENERLRQAISVAIVALRTGMPEYSADDALQMLQAALAGSKP